MPIVPITTVSAYRVRCDLCVDVLSPVYQWSDKDKAEKEAVKGGWHRMAFGGEEKWLCPECWSKVRA